MPSSSAAFVAHSASLRRSLISFTSTSLAPPTLMTATPPLSLASRSFILSFSYSDVEASMASRMVSQRCSIAAFSPEPSSITVSSLDIVTVLTEPSCSTFKSSSLPPVSSVMRSAPVRTARSCSMALRLSPKPGAWMAQQSTMPRSLFKMSVANTSFSMVSATMSTGLAACFAMVSIGMSSFCAKDIFWSVTKTNGPFASHCFAAGLAASRTRYGDR
mmetsp:Transcript_19898/g.52789  ORF Transcript_19898/g.52789 Transcript_19898/m.52789 type:complete len:217 (-) Transcript_19898:432-1082(-)